MTTEDALRIFLPAVISFIFGIGMTPILTYFLYKYKFWKQKAGKVALDGSAATTFNELHKLKEVGTPRAGGIIVWLSVLATAGLLFFLSRLTPGHYEALEFVSRNQTWVPLAALLVGSLVGFIDDFFEVRGRGGLPLRVRLLVVASIAALCAWWFYSKLEVSSVSFVDPYPILHLGLFFIPFFVVVALFLYAGGVIDGLDGLSGGIFAIIFAAYGGIAFFQNQMDLAGLCAAITGGLLAFLWFNIPPARFYLSETGSMGLTIVLTVVAFLTDLGGEGKGVVVLPIIALPLVATVFSNVLQIFWKKVFKRKLFRIAPLHHHFEAVGWPAYKVTMRYWVVGIIFATIGLGLALL
jgi:phospho-N-acetylmuramoyl-pentapeptide-transferase